MRELFFGDHLQDEKHQGRKDHDDDESDDEEIAVVLLLGCDVGTFAIATDSGHIAVIVPRFVFLTEVLSTADL